MTSILMAAAAQTSLAAMMTLQAAPQPPAATEVFLAPLTISGETVEVGKPENISNSPGYDNQPFFAPDGRTVFFTSARGSISSKVWQATDGRLQVRSAGSPGRSCHGDAGL